MLAWMATVFRSPRLIEEMLPDASCGEVRIEYPTGRARLNNSKLPSAWRAIRREGNSRKESRAPSMNGFQCTTPRRLAASTASMRLRACSRLNIWFKCHFVVPTVIDSSLAISWLVRPVASSDRILI